MGECIVLCEGWQIECCGEPFRKGDCVKWPVVKAENIKAAVPIENLKYSYDAHCEDEKKINIIEGRVSGIKALYQRYVPSQENSHDRIPCEGFLKDIDDLATGWEPEIHMMMFHAYIVSLSDYSVTPV